VRLTPQIAAASVAGLLLAVFLLGLLLDVLAILGLG
jgi:hypothetical protein